MIIVEATQLQSDRWNRHLEDGRNACGGIRPPVSPERQQDAITTYQKYGSLVYAMRELRMGRDTLKSILKSNGVSI